MARGAQAGGRMLVLGDPIVHLHGSEAFLRDGGIVVEEGRIVEVAPRRQLEGGSFDRVVGGSDYVVLPGLVNGHFHSETALSRGVSSGRIFERANVWMHRVLLPVTEEDLFNALLVRLAQLIRGGHTGVVDVYYGRPSLPRYGVETALRAYEEIGLRAALGIALRDRNTYVHAPDEEFLEGLPAELAAEVVASPIGYAWPVDDVVATYRELVGDWDRHGDRLRLITAPDWTPSCSDELYLLSRRLADEFATGITTHVLETRWELLHGWTQERESPVRRLERLGVLGPDTTLAHLVWATDDDVAVVAESGAVTATNPTSNLRSGAGICRVADLLASGASVALGTDGNSFTQTEDFFAELRLAALLQRRPDAFTDGRMPSETLLRAVAAGGARAVGFEAETGALEPGKDADLVLLRRDRIFYPDGRYAESNPLDVIVDRADARDVASVMVRGRLVLDEGRITTIDEEAARQAYAEAAAERLWRFASERERAWTTDVPRKIEPFVNDFYERWSQTGVAPGWAYNTSVGVVEPGGDHHPPREAVPRRSDDT